MPDPSLALLRLRSVTAGHAGEPALHDVSLDLDRGEIVVVAGPNGSGKSTLLELVAGILAPWAGTVLRPAAIGFVPQRASASLRVPVSVREVVAMGSWRTRRGGRMRGTRPPGRREIDAAIAAFGLSELAGRRYAALSGGQRQRALLAQAFVAPVDLLVLDEPTTGLDAETAEVVAGFLRERARQGAAVLCASHDEATIAGAARVLRLESGRIGALTPVDSPERSGAR